jgi:hypothetical protein
LFVLTESIALVALQCKLRGFGSFERYGDFGDLREFHQKKFHRKAFHQQKKITNFFSPIYGHTSSNLGEVMVLFRVEQCALTSRKNGSDDPDVYVYENN